jgi:hypothetical protein
MRKTFLASIATLFLTIGATWGDFYMTVRPVPRHTNFLPPIEFDKPYTGEPWIIRLANKEQLRSACEETSKIACTEKPSAGQTAPQCHIYMLTEQQINLEGIGLAALALRHELGHCNGWHDHTGGRETYIDTWIDLPKLPPSTHELPAFPPLACVTPEWKNDPCENRQPASGSELAG